jgi:hypothetical protein
MPNLFARRLILLLAAVTAPVHGFGQESAISREHHPWGRFEPGAWTTVRVVTETFQGEETVTSVTETKTTLVEVDDQGVTLLIETSLSVGGKQFDTEPRRVKEGFRGESAAEGLTIKSLGEGTVTIQERQILCKIEQIQYSTAAGVTTTKIYYSSTVEPYVLRRETVRTDPEGKTTSSETTMEVTALGVPCTIFRNLQRTAHVKSVHKHAQGTTTSLAVTATAVPGGLVCRTTKEFDKEERLVSRSTLDLVDWGLQEEADRTGLFHRRIGRYRRSFKSTPRRLKPSPSDG